MTVRILFRNLIFKLLNLKFCGGCTGLFLKVNAIEGSHLCDRCFRELVENAEKSV